MKFLKTRVAFTLVEVMVSIVIFSLAAGGIYAFLRHGNQQAAKAYTRQALVSQTNTLMKALQDDFRMAASVSLSISEAGGEALLQQHHGGEKVAIITYKWEKPRLTRKVVFNGKTTLHTMSNSVDGFSLETKPRPSAGPEDTGDGPEQVAIKLSMKATVPGATEPLVHDQNAMATMREVSSFKYDPHWKDVGDLKGAFSTYGNLMSSIGNDAKLLVEDIGKTFEDTTANAEQAANDALSQPRANLAETKKQLRNALNDIKQADLDLNSAIKDTEQNMRDLPEDVFERKLSRLGTWFSSKSDAVRDVSNAFNGMKTVEQMDYGKLEHAAGSYTLKDVFKNIFDSKKDALVQKNKMKDNTKELNDLLVKVEGGESGGGE